MRFPPRATGVQALVLTGLSAALAGCSSGGSQDTFTTVSLRPQEGMVRSTPRRYPDGSTSGGYYPSRTAGRATAEAPRRYVDPGQPTPREMAAYDRSYGAQSRIETASIGSGRTYDPDARWQQPPSGITTGSTGTPGPVPTGYYGRPRQAAAHGPQMVEVREGDTLYALSRRHGVPVADLMAANRLSDERIAIGQRLVIPTR
jgi:hypothetical protein